MGAPDLLHHLRGAGLTVTPADGGGIRVMPAGILTDAQRQAIRDHRAELLALLASAPPPPPPPPARRPTRWRWWPGSMPTLPASRPGVIA